MYIRPSELSSTTTLATADACSGSAGKAMRYWFLPQLQEPWRGTVSILTVCLSDGRRVRLYGELITRTRAP